MNKQAQQYINLSSVLAFCNATIGTLLFFNMLSEMMDKPNEVFKFGTYAAGLAGTLAAWGMHKAGKIVVKEAIQEALSEQKLKRNTL
jgi:hypothetical protein